MSHVKVMLTGFVMDSLMVFDSLSPEVKCKSDIPALSFYVKMFKKKTLISYCFCKEGLVYCAG